MNKRHFTCMLIMFGCATLVSAEQQDALPAERVIVRVQVVEAEIQQVVDEKAQGKEAQAQDKPVEKAAENDNTEPKPPELPSEEDLRRKMQELERELQNARMQFQQKADEQRQKVKDDTKKAIEDIQLPDNPTREQCEQFVADLRKAAEGRRSFSSNDPVTTKLSQVPAEHFDLLIKEMSDRTSLRYYANYAMREIDPEKLRERFVKSIDTNPDNIGVIVMHGWCEDIRPAIIRYMNNADSSVSPSWFQAAVEISEPSLYPKLHEITTQSRYASQFIGMLEMLPDYDLGHTLDVCWRRAREGKLATSFVTFAAKAVEYGNVDALGVLIEQLSTSSNYLTHSSAYNTRRTGVLRYIDFRGSNQEIQSWYKANKDKLVFDQLEKRFRVINEF